MASVYIKTMGCSANMAESEAMAGILEQAGNQIAQYDKDADTILVNICTVKGDNHALKEIRLLSTNNPGKKIVVGGCVTKNIVPSIEKLVPNASIINTDNIKAIADIINVQSPIRLLERKNEIKIRLPKIRSNKVVSIIPISQGCTSFCTYCSTKLVKGNIFSYPMEKIIAEARESINDGCKEIWLTSQDNGDYGFEWGKVSHLPELLARISELDGDFCVRIGMTNPISIMQSLDKMVNSLKSDKIYKFMHIPVQAGNNDVLRRMARRYTSEDFRHLVEKLRLEYPRITIATDIICGFPGETDDQFTDTLKLISEVKPDIVNISRFAARDGTAAFRMRQTPGTITKDRSTAVTEIFEKVSLERNISWIGWEGKSLVVEHGKHGSLVARNFAYKPIVIQQHNGQQIGQYVNVKVKDATCYDLRAEIIEPQE